MYSNKILLKTWFVITAHVLCMGRWTKGSLISFFVRHLPLTSGVYLCLSRASKQ